MIEQYKAFFLSEELKDVTPYAESIIEHDLETFVRAFEPYADKDLMIDPIEIAAAYGSEEIFNYLIITYDYSDFYNPFRLTLPIILMIFERESMLIDVLDQVNFSSYQHLIMYEFMIQTKELDYFKQFYKAYGIEKKHRVDLLKAALQQVEVFDYLVKLPAFRHQRKKESLLYEIIAYHQNLLEYIEDVEDLSKLFTIESFVPILKLDDEALFKKTIDFILARNLDLNAMNEFGLTFFHEGLRHAANPSYIYYLIEKGANPFFKTSKGYPSSHQLLFQDANFCLELSRYIDFDAVDLLGLKLKDYDVLQRKTDVQLLDILLIVKLVLNMDESAIYELDNAEFFDLAAIHGIDTFLNAYSVIVFENTHLKDRFELELGQIIEVDDVEPLKETLEDAFVYDEEHTLELVNDLIALEDEDFDKLIAFAKKYHTTLKISTDGVDINKIGHIEITIDDSGTVNKQATIHTNYIDVYYIHQFYDIPLENIDYIPPVSKDMRFLN